MQAPAVGTVLVADVVASRTDPGQSVRWLRTLGTALDELYGDQRLARFDFTQGDELQGLIRTDADPFRAIRLAMLHPRAMPTRWVAQAGRIHPGSGPATQRTGDAFVAARALLGEVRRQRVSLLAATGDPRADRLLEAVTPVLGLLIGDLTDRQRTVAWSLLVEGKRQAEVADALDIRRATVSIMASRGRIDAIERLFTASRDLFRDGVEARWPAGEGNAT